MTKAERYEGTPPVGVRFHEAANVFPMLAGQALDDLRADIKAHGVREPVVFLDGAILDGRNRYMAARDLGIDYPRREFGSWDTDGDDPVAFVISLNLTRRHLTESQRASAAARLANMPRGNPTFSKGANLPNSARVSNAEAAKRLNVSERSVKSARKVHDRGAPELVEALDAGKVSVSAAADLAEMPREEQAEVVAKGEAEILAAAKEIRGRRQAAKRAARVEKLTELSQRNAPLPTDRKYAIIYADPPWQYDFSPSNSRAIENHYPTMPIEDIMAMDVADMATPDAMLFLWAPPSFIKKGLAVLEAWGFDLASSMVWDKERIGTGIYFRQQHEYLLLGKRGAPLTPVPGTQPASVLRAPRGAHSAKPVEVYGLIEAMYPDLPCVELFSRAAREGWDAWGNEAHAA